VYQQQTIILNAQANTGIRLGLALEELLQVVKILDIQIINALLQVLQIEVRKALF
jgi:hypothetical protein